MFRKLARVLKEGWMGVKNHGAMTFSSASAVTMTLIIIGAFIIVNTNLQSVVDSVEDTVQIHAKIETTMTDEDIQGLKSTIESYNHVATVTYSSKEDELQFFIDSYGEQGKLFEMYVGEQNPMRNAFLIEADEAINIAEIAEKVEKLEGIESVNYGGAGTVSLVTSMENIKKASYIVVAALGVLAVLLIANTIEATITAREDEIYIMRYIGATNWFVRWPFIIEGLIIGIIGSIVPIAVLAGGYQLLYNYLGGSLFTELFALVNPNDFMLVVVCELFLIGVGVGCLGSFISVSKKLWGKR